MKEFAGVLISGGFVYTFFSLIAWWRLFKKAGYEGWCALIPLVNVYIFCDITVGSGWVFVFAFIPILNVFFALYLLSRLSKVFGHGFLFTIGLIMFYPLFVLILAFGSSQYNYI